MTAREMCARATGLVYSVARDDIDWPIHVVHKSELPEPYRGLPAAGWYDHMGDQRHRETIRDLFGTDEPGPVLVVSGNDWPTVAGLVLHEAAHLLIDGWRLIDFGEPVPAEVFTTRMVESVDMKADWSRQVHGLKWHRALAHLLARCPFDGELADLDQTVVAGEAYGFADWFTIRRKFSGEVWERRREPIKAILASPAPAEAAQLFA